MAPLRILRNNQSWGVGQVARELAMMGDELEGRIIDRRRRRRRHGQVLKTDLQATIAFGSFPEISGFPPDLRRAGATNRSGSLDRRSVPSASTCKS